MYAHQVLEAKVLGPGDLIVSLASEFIQNEDAAEAQAAKRSAEEVKQDCELKAFSRLAVHLKKAFPQVRLCFVVDALYACGRFFQTCQDNDWAYVVTFKPKDLPTAWGEFEQLLPQCPENVRDWTTPQGVHRLYRWVNDLWYVDSDGREWTFAGIRLQETVEGATTTFAWLTNLRVTAKTVEVVVWKGGRARWKIENQGFNRQKNSGLNLQHLYSTDPEKLKAYYCLLQIAFILLQLLEQGSLLRRLAAERGRTPWQLLGGMMNVAWLLLESLRRDTWAACWFVGSGLRGVHVSFQPFDTS